MEFFPASREENNSAPCLNCSTRRVTPRRCVTLALLSYTILIKEFVIIKKKWSPSPAFLRDGQGLAAGAHAEYLIPTRC